jgi:hypothetical protein
MAGVLITPKVSVNKAFYLRKMNTYCYGLFSGQASQHSLCFWNETVAQKGSNEVLSSAHEFFVKRKTGTTRLNWWGDNTSAQLKNQFMMMYCNELTHDEGFTFFTRVDNKYSPPGHTFMVHTHTHTHTHTRALTQSQENDRAFGVISRRAKKAKVIGSTKAWMDLAKTAKQPNYDCIDMKKEKFRDWKKYLTQRYRVPSRWKNTDDENVPFLKVVAPPRSHNMRMHITLSPALLPSILNLDSMVQLWSGRRGRGQAGKSP